jgi:hypothetical protein
MEDYKIYAEGNGVNVGDVLDVASVYFVSEDQIIQTPSVITGQVVTKRNVSLSFLGELDNHHYDNLLLDAEKKYYILPKIIFIRNPCRKCFLHLQYLLVNIFNSAEFTELV